MSLRNGVLAGTLATACLALPTAAPATHNEPLRGLWHLDATSCPNTFSVRGSGTCTPDSSGHARNGTLVNPDTSVAGRFGAAFDLGGSGVITAQSNAELEPAALTLIAWVKKDGAPPSGRFPVSNGGDDECGRTSYGFGTRFPSDENEGALAFTVLNGTTNYWTPAIDAAAVWDNNWHMVAGTFDGTTERFYVDGAQIGNGTAVPGPITYGLTNREFRWGQVPGDGDPCDNQDHFDGAVDETHVYSRALTSTELARMAASSGPPTLVPDTPGGGGGGGAGGGGGTLPPLPQPTVADAFSTAAKKMVWFSTKPTPLPPGIVIALIQWDFNNDGKYEASCGGSTPAISHPFLTAGTKTVGVRVTDNFGRMAVTKKIKTIGKANTNTFKGASTVYLCEQPNFTNQPSTRDCVKTFHFSIVDVNARGGANQCFKVETRLDFAAMNKKFVPPKKVIKHIGKAKPKKLARSSAVPFILPGIVPSRGIDYRASISGPVAINGLPVPLPNAVTSRYDGGTHEIAAGLGKLGFKLPTGQTITANADLNMVVKVAGGKFPLKPLKINGTAKFAGLNLGGGLDVTWIDSATLINVWLKLPNFLSDTDNKPIQGSVQLKATNPDGFSLNTADINVPSAMIGPLAVEGLFFHYAAQAGGDVLQGGFNASFPGGAKVNARPPPANHGIGFRGGEFDYAGLGFDFPDPRPQIFPGVELKHIDGVFANNPIRITGGVGITALKLVDIDGTLFIALARPDQPYTFQPGQAPPGLKFIEGKRIDSFTVAIGGQSYLLVPVLKRVPLADAHILYSYPDYIELGGNFSYDAGLLSTHGFINGWAAAKAGKFNLEGRLDTCAGFRVKVPIVGRIDVHVCEFVNGLVSTRGIGACVGADLPIVGEVSVGLGYAWGDLLPDVYLLSCSLGDYREIKPAGVGPRAAQAARSFTLPGGLPSAQIRIVGRGGVPGVTITGPGGQKIVVPAADDGVPTGKDFVALPQSQTDTMFVALKKPRAGRYTVSALDGAPIRSVAVANGMNPPKIRANVTGRGQDRVLRYTLQPAAGQDVTFVEQGAQTYRVIGKAKGRKGQIKFAPADGLRGTRKIVALVDRGGVTRFSLDVARFSASPVIPPRPRRLRVKLRAKGIAITWRGVSSARTYAVTMQLTNGQRVFRVTKRRRVTLAVGPQARGSVSVRGLSSTGRRGKAARKTFRCVPLSVTCGP